MKQEIVVTVSGKEVRIPVGVRPEVAARAALRNLPLFVLFEDMKNDNNEFLSAIRSLICGFCYIETENFPYTVITQIHERIEYSRYESYPEHRFSKALLESNKTAQSILRSIEHAEENQLELSHFEALNLDLDKDDKISLNDRLWIEELDAQNAKIIHNFTSALTTQPEFHFWREWYQGFLEGEPLDWELQRRVALIENSIWEAGPEAVAKEIEKIRAKFDLEKHIVKLEADLHRVTVNRHGIGGNMPPEALDDALIARELIIVWQPLEDLKDEIAKDDTNTKRLQEIIEALVTALKRGFTWCLKKGDLIVDTAIKWAIPAGGTGYLALNPEKLEAVIEAANKLLGAL